MQIAIVTAGGAGMYCGSCMHDNTWARALIGRGEQVTLIPTYTPLKLDEENVGIAPVFLGGLNLYLAHRFSWWNRVPRFLTRWLDRPDIIDRATRSSVSNNATELGELTVALLKGANGPQRVQLEELVQYLTRELRPDVICFSNALLSGIMPLLRAEFPGTIVCTLQGDDIFLNDLVEPFRQQALDLLRSHVRLFDGFLVHSDYYRDWMSTLLDVPAERFHRIPLTFDTTGHTGVARRGTTDQVTVGYFARICPEKGLHLLVEACKRLLPRHPGLRVLAGGYLGPRDTDYFAQVQQAAEPLGAAFQYVGSPDRGGKIEFLKSLDLLAVPTVYQEPKGLYVLEAWANGVPVLVPAHGAFPELLRDVPGGSLFRPGDVQDLANALEGLLLDPDQRYILGSQGYQGVRTLHTDHSSADRTLAVFQSLTRLGG